MAPRIAGEVAGGMAHGGHIRCKNYEFIYIKGPEPASAHGYDPNLHNGDPGHEGRSEHTLKTTSEGSILEFTYPEGPIPSPTSGRDQASCLGNQRSMARNQLT